MKMLLFSSLVIAASMSSAAFADTTPIDFDLAHKLAPQGSDVAKYRIAVYNGAPDQDAREASKGSFIKADFNGDGIPDFAVVYEKNPTFTDQNNAPCTNYDPSNPSQCYLNAGERTLQIWFGQPNGQFSLVASNSRLVLGAQDGGVWGDPMNDLTLNKRGSLQVGAYGGSSWRWWHDDVIQFRGNGFYIVGMTDGSMHNTEPETTNDTTEINYLTGVVIKSKGKHAPVTSRVPVKPLVNLKDYVNPLLKDQDVK